AALTAPGEGGLHDLQRAPGERDDVRLAVALPGLRLVPAPRDLAPLHARDVLDYHVAQLGLPELPLADPGEVAQLAHVPDVLGREVRVDGVEDGWGHVPTARRFALLGEREPGHEPPLLLGEGVAALEEAQVAVAGAAGQRPLSPRRAARPGGALLL